MSRQQTIPARARRLAWAPLAVLGLWTVDLAGGPVPVPTFVAPAEAVIGRPLTPVSYAGMARRTTRRAVYASSASAAAAAAPQPVEQAAQPVAAPAAPAATLPKGSAVTALPAGCQQISIDGGSYFNCAGTIYKPTFQGSSLVYVVQ